MKGYLVDTNIPPELTRERPDARVAAFLADAGQSRVFLSVLTIGEICKGIAELPASQKRTGLQDWLDIEVRSWFAGRILPVTEPIAERWGFLAAAAEAKGHDLGHRGWRDRGNSPSPRPDHRNAECEGFRRSRRRRLQSVARHHPTVELANPLGALGDEGSNIWA